MKISSPNYTRNSWPLAIAALGTILASCFAPWLFTLPGGIDFTNTGEIGDTIGGTMSPFVGIAGVIMTFVAFMMQVRANEIQREQLGKSFLMKDVESKIEDRRAMELLKLDVDNAIIDIEERCKCIDVFCKKIEQNPLDNLSLKRPSFTSLSRYQSINRNRLFNAFKVCFEDKGRSILQSVYLYLDYYHEAVSMLYNELDKELEKNVDDCRFEISSAFISIRRKAKEEKYKHDLWQAEILRDFIENCNKVIKDGEPQIVMLNDLIQDAQFNEIYRDVLESEHNNIRELIDSVRAKNLARCKALKNAADEFRSKDCLGTLREISIKLETALNEHTEQKIISDFEKKTGLCS